MGKLIVVTSGKGGVGKSTVAVNLAYGLAFDERRVLLIDMDAGLRSLDLMLGTENELVFDLTDVLDGICTPEQAIFEIKRRPGLFLLPASQNSGSAAVTPANVRSLLASLNNAYDYIILDCPAGIERGFRNAVTSAEEAILVITPDYISLRSAERTFQLLTSEGLENIRLVINRIGKRPPVSTDECIASGSRLRAGRSSRGARPVAGKTRDRHGIPRRRRLRAHRAQDTGRVRPLPRAA